MDSLHDRSETVKAGILVADDDSDMRDMVCEILALKNFVVTPFDPVASDRAILRRSYDVVILDIFMPGIDGFKLREEVLHHSPYAQFIIITGRPDPGMVDRLMELGIHDFLTKPFTCDQILYSVMGAVRTRKLLGENCERDVAAGMESAALIIGALRRIDAIVNCMGEGLLAMDNDNAVVLMNNVAEKITGMRFGECAGTHLEHSNARKEVKEYLLPRMSGTISESEDTPLMFKDGPDVRYYSVKIQNVIDCSGELTGRVVLFLDRTEAKHFETLRDSFLNVAAHELRTPITVMMNYLCLISKKDDDREMLRIAIDDMLSANRRMKYLVNSIINFVTLSSRDVPVHKTAVDVGSIIRDEMAKLENETKKKNITVEVTIHLASLRFFLDPDLVTIALNSVLNNAVKFNRKNGIVRIDVKKKPVNGGPGISIDVSDEGEGIPPRVADTLFEGFKQGEEHLTRVHSGLGTGLFIAQRAVMLLGGTLRGESLQGRGSRFSLELPCSRTGIAQREITADIL